jgi:hypothetical protein
MKLSYEKYKNILVKKSVIPEEEKEKIGYEAYKKGIEAQLITNVLTSGIDIFKNYLLDNLNTTQKANRIFKVVNIISEKPEVQQGIKYLVNHKDFSKHDYNKVKDIVCKYAKTFPITTATNPDLLVPLIKSHLETGIVPIDYLKNLNDLELKYYR